MSHEHNSKETGFTETHNLAPAYNQTQADSTLMDFLQIKPGQCVDISIEIFIFELHYFGKNIVIIFVPKHKRLLSHG